MQLNFFLLFNQIIVWTWAAEKVDVQEHRYHHSNNLFSTCYTLVLSNFILHWEILFYCLNTILYCTKNF